jgi:hypothetical protein
MMALRTSLKDAKNVEVADDIDDFVSDKRADWRATAAKGLRRQRRYKKRLTQGIWRPSGDPLHTANFILDTIECAADRQAMDKTSAQTQLAHLEVFLSSSLGVLCNN